MYSQHVSYSNPSYADGGAFTSASRYLLFPFHRDLANHVFVDGHARGIKATDALPGWSMTTEYRSYWQWWLN
jgi:hypothetical protein